MDRIVTAEGQVVTQYGDTGMTKIFDGCSMSKGSPLIHAIGSLDTCMAQILKIMSIVKDDNPWLYNYMDNVYNKLMVTAGELSNYDYEKLKDRAIQNSDIIFMDKQISEIIPHLPKFEGFVRFSQPVSLEYNELRVRVRESERYISMVQKVRPEVRTYLNRLSDYTFLVAVLNDKESK